MRSQTSLFGSIETRLLERLELARQFALRAQAFHHLRVGAELVVFYRAALVSDFSSLQARWQGPEPRRIRIPSVRTYRPVGKKLTITEVSHIREALDAGRSTTELGKR